MRNVKFNNKIENLASLGNVLGDLPQRRVIPMGPSNSLTGLILKEYILQENGKFPQIKEDWIGPWKLLKKQFKTGKLKPLSGMGFSILSSGILNVCRWDSQYIDVIVPQIYTFENGLWKPQKVEDVGAFCSGEKRVYDHENNAWLKYLNTKRTDEDKLDYLNNLLVE